MMQSYGLLFIPMEKKTSAVRMIVIILIEANACGCEIYSPCKMTNVNDISVQRKWTF